MRFRVHICSLQNFRDEDLQIKNTSVQSKHQLTEDSKIKLLLCPCIQNAILCIYRGDSVYIASMLNTRICEHNQCTIFNVKSPVLTK